MGSAQLSWTSKFNRRTIMNTSVSLKPERKIYSGQNTDFWRKKEKHLRASRNIQIHQELDTLWWATTGRQKEVTFWDFIHSKATRVTTIALNPSHIIYATEGNSMYMNKQCSQNSKKNGPMCISYFTKLKLTNVC